MKVRNEKEIAIAQQKELAKQELLAKKEKEKLDKEASKALVEEYMVKHFSAVEALKISELKEKQLNEQKKASIAAHKTRFKAGIFNELELEHAIYGTEANVLHDAISNINKTIEEIKPVIAFGNEFKVSKAIVLKTELILQKAIFNSETLKGKLNLLVEPDPIPVVSPAESAFIQAKEAEENALKQAAIDSLTVDGLKFIDELNRDKYLEMKERYNKYILLNIEGKPLVSTVVNIPGKNTVNYYHSKFHDFREFNCDDYFFVESGKKERKIYFAEHWLETKHLRRKYTSTAFDPSPDFNDPDAYNFWKGFVEPRKGDVSRFYNHIDILIKGTKEQKEHLIKKIGYTVRYPHHNIGNAIALRGKQGSGKTTAIADAMMAMCPNHSMMTSDLEEFLTGFNGETVYIKYVLGEEALWGGDKTLEGKFKHAVTGQKRRIEIKGITSFQVDNYCQFFFTTNEDWVMPVGENDRRAEIFDCTDTLIGNRKYFAEYREWLFGEGKHALVYHFMHELDLDGFDPRELVENDAKLDVKLQSLGHVEKFIYSSLNGEISDLCLDKWTDIEFNIKRADLFEAFKDNTRSKVDQKVFSGVLNKVFNFPENWKDNWKNSTKGSFYKLGTLVEARLKFCRYVKADYKSLFGSDVPEGSALKEEEVKKEVATGIQSKLVPLIKKENKELSPVEILRKKNQDALLAREKSESGPKLPFSLKKPTA